MDLIKLIFSILLPPLGVFLEVGIGLHFWLNILLTLLGYIPGIIHAVWITRRVGADCQRRCESGVKLPG